MCLALEVKEGERGAGGGAGMRQPEQPNQVSSLMAHNPWFDTTNLTQNSGTTVTWTLSLEQDW